MVWHYVDDTFCVIDEVTAGPFIQQSSSPCILRRTKAFFLWTHLRNGSRMEVLTLKCTCNTTHTDRYIPVVYLSLSLACQEGCSLILIQPGQDGGCGRKHQKGRERCDWNPEGHWVPCTHYQVGTETQQKQTGRGDIEVHNLLTIDMSQYVKWEFIREEDCLLQQGNSRQNEFLCWSVFTVNKYPMQEFNKWSTHNQKYLCDVLTTIYTLAFNQRMHCCGKHTFRELVQTICGNLNSLMLGEGV